MIICSVLMYVSSLMGFLFSWKHVLGMVLSLELMMLSSLYGMFFLILVYYEEDYFLLYMFTLAVCEGVLGLSLIVSLIRTHGGDFFSSMNLMQC